MLPPLTEPGVSLAIELIIEPKASEKLLFISSGVKVISLLVESFI